MISRPAASSGSGTFSPRTVRQSMNTAEPRAPNSDANWSMIPVGAPTTSFSARWQARASSVRLAPSPCRSSSASATAQSSAADDDSPDPVGTTESM